VKCKVILRKPQKSNKKGKSTNSKTTPGVEVFKADEIFRKLTSVK
jgi:hypothetical protein